MLIKEAERDAGRQQTNNRQNIWMSLFKQIRKDAEAVAGYRPDLIISRA